MPSPRLTREFYARDALDVAPDLLGRHVTHAGVTVRLTEVEAYRGEDDPGSHAFRGRTPRTAVMFGPPGHLYVYFTYGMHWCANVVVGSEGRAAAVLLRAGEVVAGHDVAAHRRTGVRERDWARGPARLARTLALGRAEDGASLLDGRGPVLEHGTPVGDERIRTGPRVGVTGAGGDGALYPWRFWVADEPTVSAYRPGKLRNRRPPGGVASP